MEDRTRAIIEMLTVAEWFSSVGQPVNSDVIAVYSWEDTISNRKTYEWEIAQISSSNELTSTVSSVANARYQKWNDVVGEVGKIVRPMVQVRMANFIEQYKLTRPFVNAVIWDVVHIAMSAEYSDIFTPTFYADLAYWYVKGHFPCGWDGDYPLGRLIIY